MLQLHLHLHLFWGAHRKKKHLDFFHLFSVVFPNIWPLAGPNIAKRVGRYKNWRGSIDKPILELLTFGSHPDFGDFGVFCVFLRMFCSPKGGCASSRLDHGLKFYGIQGGCASSRLISGSQNPKKSKKCTKKCLKIYKKWLFWVGLYMCKNTQNMRKTRQNHQNPGLSQKLKVPKWVCRSTLASFCHEPTPFRDIWPR